MNKLIKVIILNLSCLFAVPLFAYDPSYCDTSAGRVVKSDGGYSKRYCRWTAVMDFQGVHTCCTWQGGVLVIKNGLVICNDGTVSPICSIQETRLHKQNPYAYK